jgi:hypothetical protein
MKNSSFPDKAFEGIKCEDYDAKARWVVLLIYSCRKIIWLKWKPNIKGGKRSREDALLCAKFEPITYLFWLSYRYMYVTLLTSNMEAFGHSAELQIEVY